MAFWNENREKARQEKSKMTSSALCWPRAEAIKEIQRRSCSRWRREAGPGEDGEKSYEGDQRCCHCDGFPCLEGVNALVVMVAILVGERDVVGACAGESWKAT